MTSRLKLHGYIRNENYMRNYSSIISVVALCVVVTACSNDTSSLGSADSKPDTASTQNAVLAPWNESLQGAKKSELCALDAVNGQKATNGSFAVESTLPVAFEGWVSTSDMHTPESVSIVLHGATSFAVNSKTGIERGDVAEAYKTHDLTNSGYKAELATLSIPVGNYAVSLVHEEKGSKVVCDAKSSLVVK